MNFELLSSEICTKISLRMWRHGGHLAGQNKETTATLEKLVNLISMKTKEYSIGSHFESSLNWAQNNTKSVEFNSRNNRKVLLIQWNHTKEWPLSWYCVVYLVSFVSSNLCRIEEFINWCYVSHVGYQNKDMAAILMVLLWRICMKTIENLDQPPFYEKFGLALRNIPKTFQRQEQWSQTPNITKSDELNRRNERETFLIH